MSWFTAAFRSPPLSINAVGAGDTCNQLQHFGLVLILALELCIGIQVMYQVYITRILTGSFIIRSAASYFIQGSEFQMGCGITSS